MRIHQCVLMEDEEDDIDALRQMKTVSICSANVISDNVRQYQTRLSSSWLYCSHIYRRGQFALATAAARSNDFSALFCKMYLLTICPGRRKVWLQILFPPTNSGGEFSWPAVLGLRITCRDWGATVQIFTILPKRTTVLQFWPLKGALSLPEETSPQSYALASPGMQPPPRSTFQIIQTQF